MEVISSTIGDVVVLKLYGSLRSRDDIAAEFRRLLRAGKTKFILNFENVRSVNSIGLSTILEFKHLAEAVGGKIMLCGIHEEVKKVFNVTRMAEIFSMVDDEDIALAGFIKGLPLISSDSSVSRHRN
jgi:stage II sporulation protein AA (anti-sigma F factor antagonist)